MPRASEFTNPLIPVASIGASNRPPTYHYENGLCWNSVSMMPWSVGHILGGI